MIRTRGVTNKSVRVRAGYVLSYNIYEHENKKALSQKTYSPCSSNISSTLIYLRQSVPSALWCPGERRLTTKLVNDHLVCNPIAAAMPPNL
jgi:thiamine kinase-like enzyme